MESLIDSIYKAPQDWTVSEHVFRHKSGFMFWTANSFYGFSVYKCSLHMTFFQRIRAYRAFKWWCSNAPISTIN